MFVKVFANGRQTYTFGESTIENITLKKFEIKLALDLSNLDKYSKCIKKKRKSVWTCKINDVSCFKLFLVYNKS